MQSGIKRALFDVILIFTIISIYAG